MLKRTGLLLVALIIVLAACGGDDAVKLSAEEQAFADDLVTQLTADTDPANPLADEANARCAAEGVVGGFGLERSQELFGGAIDINDLAAVGADMTEAERSSFADVVVGCVDIAEVAIEGLAAESGGMVSEDDATCIAGKIDDDAQKQLLLAELSGEEADPTVFLGAITECVDMQALLRDQLLAMQMPEAAVNCIVDGLSDDFFSNLLGGMLSGEDPGLSDPEFMNLIQTCMGG